MIVNAILGHGFDTNPRQQTWHNSGHALFMHHAAMRSSNTRRRLGKLELTCKLRTRAYALFLYMKESLPQSLRRKASEIQLHDGADREGMHNVLAKHIGAHADAKFRQHGIHGIIASIDDGGNARRKRVQTCAEPPAATSAGRSRERDGVAARGNLARHGSRSSRGHTLAEAPRNNSTSCCPDERSRHVAASSGKSCGRCDVASAWPALPARRRSKKSEARACVARSAISSSAPSPPEARTCVRRKLRSTPSCTHVCASTTATSSCTRSRAWLGTTACSRLICTSCTLRTWYFCRMVSRSALRSASILYSAKKAWTRSGALGAPPTSCSGPRARAAAGSRRGFHRARLRPRRGFRSRPRAPGTHTRRTTLRAPCS